MDDKKQSASYLAFEREQSALGRMPAKLKYEWMLKECKIEYVIGPGPFGFEMCWVREAFAFLLRTTTRDWSDTTRMKAIRLLQTHEQVAIDYESAWRLGDAKQAWDIITKAVTTLRWPG